MDVSFEVLERKVRQAAELIARLRQEKQSLEKKLGEAKAALEKAERTLAAAERERASDPSQAAQLHALEGELATLTREREEVRRRISRLVGLLDGLD
jgi:predicted RNase H-like nuclease (RuvC/YqgF family)